MENESIETDEAKRVNNENLAENFLAMNRQG